MRSLPKPNRPIIHLWPRPASEPITVEVEVQVLAKSMHHLYFNFNYGQFTTLWDRLGGSHRKPNEELFRRETKMGKKEWERQSKEMENIVRQVEGSDDCKYEPEPQQAEGKKVR